MDPFELIRAQAAALFDEATAAGADPFDPLALALRAASLRDLEVHWLPVKDAALRGARALYDDQSGIILCERDADPATRALLVAHELGHAELTPGPASCGARDIDAAQSTEGAAVGLTRVLDYGARERRELQANVYARELLAPRSFVCAQHLSQDLSAAQIAGRTGLSVAVVRQQLFDGLLLPPPQRHAPAPATPAAAPPDASQERAARHRGRPFQLQAGPGTGKTRTLVLRVLSLLKEGIDPAAILILTFSNRAAAELAERLAAHVPEAAARLWIGTFHAFGLDLLRRFHDRLGLPPDPRLFDRSDAIAVLEELLPILPLEHYRSLWDPVMVLRDIVAAISRAKDELADPVRYRRLAQQMKAAALTDEERIEAEKCLEIAAIYDRYEEALRKHGGVDFGDLILRPAQLLEQDEPARISVQLRHRHVLVDEYQDVNRASARLLALVAGDGQRLWVVGDARQSIYRFRGASSENMARFITDYPGAVVDQLGVNYRSSRQIVDSCVSVAARMGASGGMLPLALTAARGPSSSWPEIRSFETPEEEAEGVAAGIHQLQQAGVALRAQAVLCRSNARLNEIAASLEARGIPVLHLGSLFEREEIRDLLAVLSLAVDPFGDALVRVGAMPRYGLSLQDARCVTRHVRALRKPVLAALPQAQEAAGLSEAGRAAMARLAADLAGLTADAHAWDFLSVYLLDRTGLARQLAQADSVTGQIRAMAVWQLLNFLREAAPAGAGLPIQKTLDRIRSLVLLAEERDLRQVPPAALHLDAVRLMTVHAAKGLEFEAVHVPGLTVASFPASRQGQRCPAPAGMIEGADDLVPVEEARRIHSNEEECLFFVALSRAISRLRLYHSRQRKPSPYLAWLPPALVREIASPPAPPLPANVAQLQLQVRWPAGWELTDRRLASYEKCPRRFFYTHVLGLGGAQRRTTAFARTHACIYELVAWLADARRVRQPGLAEAEAAFEEIWKARGPARHAYAAEYRALASRLIEALLAAGAGERFREAQPLAIDLPNGRVVVEPHQIADAPDGTVIIRRVSTGRRNSEEYDRIEYTLYVLAAQAHYGSQATVQALHLSEGNSVMPVQITPKKLETRRRRSDTMVRLIAAGEFPAQPDAVSCPRCPHFFLCAALPRGPLDLT